MNAHGGLVLVRVVGFLWVVVVIRTCDLRFIDECAIHHIIKPLSTISTDN